MSDDTQYLTAEIAEERATITETVELPSGNEYLVDVKEATLDEITEFEQREQAGEDELELMREAVEEYIVKPSGLNAGAMGRRKLEPIMEALFRAWGASEGDIDEALADRSGN